VTALLQSISSTLIIVLMPFTLYYSWDFNPVKLLDYCIRVMLSALVEYLAVLGLAYAPKLLLSYRYVPNAEANAGGEFML